jgi:hypothetical protein
MGVMQGKFMLLASFQITTGHWLSSTSTDSRGTTTPKPESVEARTVRCPGVVLTF